MKDKILMKGLKVKIIVSMVLFFSFSIVYANNINLKSSKGFYNAIRQNNLELVKHLIIEKKDINTLEEYNYTPLHLAVRLNRFDIVKTLINTGAKVNTIDSYGDTPLEDSTRNDYTKISKLLICNGANIHVKDAEGMTPLDNAIKNKNTFISKMLKAKNIKPYCIKPKPIIAPPKKEVKLLLEVNDHGVYDTPKPNICGKIISGDFKGIEVSFLDEKEKTYGPYKSKINKDQGTWCVAPTKQIANGKYKANVLGKGQKGKTTKVESSFIVNFNWTLYQALKKEFKNDFKAWDAELDKNSLTFRFKKPGVLFQSGKKDLRENFKAILDDFFPRYLKVLEAYKAEIKEVKIEGHTSSVWKTAKSDKERYDNNLILSQKRADEVKRYLLKDEKVKEIDNKWLDNTFKPYGLSYSRRIFNLDGTENYNASRRVEFEIVRKI